MNVELKKRSNLILGVLFFGWIVSYIDRTAISLALISIGKDLSLSATELGFVLSAFFFGYAAMQIPGGWLTDKYGTIKLLVGAVIFWSVFTAFTGLAWSLTSLLLIRFLFGIGEGGYPAASTKAISIYFQKEQRTKAQSTMMSSNMIGGAIAPIICAPLLLVMDWRNVFFLISGLGIIFVIALLWSTKNAQTFISEERKENKEKGSFRKVLKNTYLMRVLLVFFFINIANWGLISWMPTYLMQVHGLDLKKVGFISAIPAIFGMIGMIISGRIISKLGGRSKYGVIFGAVVLAVCLYLMSTAASAALAITYQSIAFIFVSFMASFIFTTPHRVVNQQNVGTAFGIVNFGGQAAGIISPTIMGYLINVSGGSFKTSFIFLAIMCVIAAVIAVTLPVNHQQQTNIKSVEGYEL
ncbi:MFS transporter [Lysinibacillus xylanilyticus]|uniref:MFS transporter n=1 Tax=Lysinibacillus xylanilyticus TaxID=582475 RepID=A0A2M9PXZ5_9BACI|nr:MFS transporter [Lysinibacillus xylanilyticus]PJO40714.1 MFS transporter [Lysinibacillus xylanilyticus]